MVTKRKHEERTERKSKGFQVGPANLPDGTHRRKVIKIKESLIHKAKVKKEFAKIKAKHDQEAPTPSYIPAEEVVAEPATLELHPDRQAQLEEPEVSTEQPIYPRKHHRQRQDPFAKESQFAQQKREEAEKRQQEREEANRQRKQALEGRERMRRAVVKARTPGRDGKRKLGRESGMLLEKVKKMVASKGG
ncbi:hypothetical protein EJ08DRAFT_729957 [Tothia fuscella]|uniref:rRNA-processing protein FYV7 n=1 Tax=Tothia fuscella TaxID=1048955 RepID=A0A9P4P1C4_9PEZI|nr:hypothetical protein EJ08DRAFT_729957 [Tothia fuscella]